MSRQSSANTGLATVAIIGADTVLAALPATPIQLAHACRSLGYELTFPATWGDELVAQACLAAVRARGAEPVILCACPHVLGQLTRNGSDLATWMLTVAAPPVAAARYLRAAYATRPVHITFIGSCPSATDPSIDARLSPEELFAAFAEHGIVAAEQPQLFDSLLPPDRRRFYSLPGGIPSPDQLAVVDPQRALIELEGEDFLLEMAQRLLERQRVLVDLAPRLGCVCSGVLVPGAVHGARPALVALEPPRARVSVLDPAIFIDMGVPPGTTGAGGAPDAAAQSGVSAASIAPAVPAPAAGSVERSRRRPVPPILRAKSGRTIPRAFAIHHRSKRVPNFPPRPRLQHPAARPARTGARAADAYRAPNHSARETRHSVVPLATAPPGPVPPPPTTPRSGQLLELGANLRGG